jgi:hypothetical protein
MPTTRAPVLTMKSHGAGVWRPATANDGRRLDGILRHRQLDQLCGPVARNVGMLVAICEHAGVELVFRPGPCPAPRGGAARGRKSLRDL